MMSLEEKVQCFHNVFNQLSKTRQTEYLDNFCIRYTHESTTIEGNTCSYFDTVLLLTEGLTPAGKQLNEVYEIVGHDKAIKLLLNYAQSKTAISEDVICALYKEVIFPVVHTNSYRKSEVYIRGATHSSYLSRNEIFIADLSNKNFSSPIEKAAFAHAQLVKIHPFYDGNGRTSRLIMNLSLLNDDYSMLNIKKEMRSEYLFALNQYGENKDLNPFIKFMETAMIHQIDEFLNKYRLQ